MTSCYLQSCLLANLLAQETGPVIGPEILILQRRVSDVIFVYVFELLQSFSLFEILIEAHQLTMCHLLLMLMGYFQLCFLITTFLPIYILRYSRLSVNTLFCGVKAWHYY